MPACNSCSLYFLVLMRCGKNCPPSHSIPSKRTPTWGAIFHVCKKSEDRKNDKKKWGHLFHSSSNSTLVAARAKTTTVPPASGPGSHSCVHAADQTTVLIWWGIRAGSALWSDFLVGLSKCWWQHNTRDSDKGKIQGRERVRSWEVCKTHPTSSSITAKPTLS